MTTVFYCRASSRLGEGDGYSVRKAVNKDQYRVFKGRTPFPNEFNSLAAAVNFIMETMGIFYSVNSTATKAPTYNI